MTNLSLGGTVHVALSTVISWGIPLTSSCHTSTVGAGLG